MSGVHRIAAAISQVPGETGPRSTVLAKRLFHAIRFPDSFLKALNAMIRDLVQQFELPGGISGSPFR